MRTTSHSFEFTFFASVAEFENGGSPVGTELVTVEVTSPLHIAQFEERLGLRVNGSLAIQAAWKVPAVLARRARQEVVAGIVTL